MIWRMCSMYSVQKHKCNLRKKRVWNTHAFSSITDIPIYFQVYLIGCTNFISYLIYNSFYKTWLKYVFKSLLYTWIHNYFSKNGLCFIFDNDVTFHVNIIFLKGETTLGLLPYIKLIILESINYMLNASQTNSHSNCMSIVSQVPV